MILLHESKHWRIYANLCEKYFERNWTYFSPPQSGMICWIRWRKRNHCCDLELLCFVIEICPLCLWSDLVLSSMTLICHQVSKKFIFCEVVVTALWLELVTVSLFIWLVNCEHNECHCIVFFFKWGIPVVFYMFNICSVKL
jgi:hypothetical protein